MAPRFHRLIASIVCIALVLAASQAAFADLLPIAWDGGALTFDWNDPPNWDIDVVPDNDETNEFDVTIEAADVALTGSDVTISGLTIGDTASLSIHDSSLTMTGGSTIANQNLISLSGTSPTAGSILEIAGGELSLTGGGSITLDDSLIYGEQGTDSLINEDNTIHGTGGIGFGGMYLINRGTIIADAYYQSSIDLGPGSVTNSGTLQAENSSTLQLSDTTCTNFEDDVAGRIVAEWDGLILFESCTVIGGQIEVHDDGLVYLRSSNVIGSTTTIHDGGEVVGYDGSTLGGAFNNHVGGRIAASDGGSFAIAGTGPHINNGVIGFAAYGRTTSLHFAGPADLEGSGTVTLKDETTSVIFDTDQSFFTNKGNTFEGAGLIDASWRPVINQGEILANRAEPLRINPPLEYGVFDNQGTINVTGAGGLTIYYGAFTTSGQVYVAEGSRLYRYEDYIQTAGSTIVNGELAVSALLSTTDDKLRSINGVFITGMLGGGGRIEGDVVHLGGGSVAPGQSIGTLTIHGDYLQASDTILEIELGGTEQGESDLLDVSYKAILDGVLSVSLADGFIPESGQSFPILKSAHVYGTFASVLPVNFPAPLTVDVVYESDCVRLVIGAIPGLGACCHANGSCEVIAESSCDLPDDLFSPGEPCSPLTCPELVECCAGDVNGDQLVNGLDVDAFVAGLLNPPMPGTVQFCRLDANGDRLDVDIEDVPPFVALLMQGAMCEISCCPGDLNGDNMLNGSDIAPLQDAIDNPPKQGTIEFCRADVNEDLHVNNADASALALKLLMGETCPGSELSLKMILSGAQKLDCLLDSHP